MSNTEIRRKKMKKNSSEKTRLKSKNGRFNLNTHKAIPASLGGDLNGCVLVIPEIFGLDRPPSLYNRTLSGYHL